MERHLAFHLLVGSSNICSTEPTRNYDLDSLCTGLHGALHRQAHCTPVGDTSLNLLTNAATHKCCIKFRLSYFLDVQARPTFGQLLKLTAQFVNALAASPDDDARSSRVDCDYKILWAAFDLDFRDCTALTKLAANELPDGVILGCQSAVLTGSTSKPVGLPVHYTAEAESDWVGFLSH